MTDEQAERGDVSKRNPEEFPLKCSIKDRKLIFEIGLDTVAWAAQHHPLYWEAPPKIVDVRKFADDVVAALNREEENGDTLLTTMLDNAIEHVMEYGSEGLADD